MSQDHKQNDNTELATVQMLSDSLAATAISVTTLLELLIDKDIIKRDEATQRYKKLESELAESDRLMIPHHMIRSVLGVLSTKQSTVQSEKLDH